MPFPRRCYPPCPTPEMAGLTACALGTICADRMKPGGAPRRPSVRRLSTGADLAAQGDPLRSLSMVIDGWLAFYELLEDGRRQVLHIVVPGDVLVPPHPGEDMPYGIQSVTPSLVCLAPPPPAHGDTPATVAMIMAVTSRNAALAYGHLTALGRRTARERVAYLLVELYTRCRAVMPPDRAVRIPLTQAVLGDALGLTSVHVNRTLRRLRGDGLLTYDAGCLRLLDPDRLAAVACLDTEAPRRWLVPPAHPLTDAGSSERRA
ncbi:cAMP-binding protein [Caenispirillum salinarum AK4]|uniref:cAMP-binding protein n=1 Tax=Caenispirillum salinarum AK4 TaxID=1238182 RepID=K9H779_9PROT|nr:Crp/Fnr family transcriptional regulator [Caenispirillum salinarum]EKV32944.1 cAMP-binding protein [Caenispirillum salinarum AK4]